MWAKTQVDELYAGEVGYFSAAIKQVADARVGDTITSKKNSATEALPGCGLLLMLMSPFLHLPVCK
jgi:translation elongation factor EF-4